MLYVINISLEIIEDGTIRKLEGPHRYSVKTRTVGGQKNGQKSVRMCLLVSMQYTNVTDRRTDRHRTTAQITLCIVLRGKNNDDELTL